MNGLVRLLAAGGLVVAPLALAPVANAQIGIDIYQRAPMADAAVRGDIAKVRALLLNGQSPNGVDLEEIGRAHV